MLKLVRFNQSATQQQKSYARVVTVIGPQTISSHLRLLKLAPSMQESQYIGFTGNQEQTLPIQYTSLTAISQHRYFSACRLVSPRRRHCRPSGAVSKQSFSHDVSAWTLLEIAVLCFTPIVSYSIVKCSCSPRTL